MTLKTFAFAEYIIDVIKDLIKNGKVKLHSLKEIYSLYDQLKAKKDLVLIATNIPSTWCKCKPKADCLCDEEASETGNGEVSIFRSMENPGLCFYQKFYIDFSSYRESVVLYKFSYEDIMQFLDEDDEFLVFKPKLHDRAIRARLKSLPKVVLNP